MRYMQWNLVLGVSLCLTGVLPQAVQADPTPPASPTPIAVAAPTVFDLSPQAVATVKAEIYQNLATKIGPTPMPPGPYPTAGVDHVFCAQLYRAHAEDAVAEYRLLDGFLQVADQLLTRPDSQQGATALGIALEATRCASLTLQDSHLAGLLCAGYLLPNLAYTPQNAWEDLSTEDILTTVASVYGATAEMDKQMDALHILIDTTDDRNTADAARVRLIGLYRLVGNYADALDTLDKIDPTGELAGVLSIRPDIVRQLQQTAPQP
jgi:hypothetical protein